jgi:hypothetical protein
LGGKGLVVFDQQVKCDQPLLRQLVGPAFFLC